VAQPFLPPDSQLFPLTTAQATQRDAGSMIAAVRRPVQLLQRKKLRKNFRERIRTRITFP
jgi:hypothetical protein